MAALVPTLLWLSLGPIVTVEGDTVCPTPEEVEGRVAALLPARETDEPADVARIEVADGSMRVTLARPDGSVLAERTIAGRFPCTDLAEAAAVVVATWESDVHPEFRPAPPPSPPPPVAAVAPPPPPRPRASYDVGVALLGSVAPSGGHAAPAVGALVVGTWSPAPLGFGARLALWGAGERSLELGAGQVRWRRVAAALGPELRVASAAGRGALDLHAEGLAAWVTAEGDGFTTDRRESAIDPGVGAGIRALGIGAGLVVPWVDVSAAGWLRPQAAYATPGADSVTLPRFEAAVALGLSYRGQ